MCGGLKAVDALDQRGAGDEGLRRGRGCRFLPNTSLLPGLLGGLHADRDREGARLDHRVGDGVGDEEPVVLVEAEEARRGAAARCRRSRRRACSSSVGRQIGRSPLRCSGCRDRTSARVTMPSVSISRQRSGTGIWSVGKASGGGAGPRRDCPGSTGSGSSCCGCPGGGGRRSAPPRTAAAAARPAPRRAGLGRLRASRRLGRRRASCRREPASRPARRVDAGVHGSRIESG